MSADMVIDIAREAIWLIIKCSSPLLVVSLIVGLIVSILQTVTSIQEQTLTFVPKIISVFITLLISGEWIMNNIILFMEHLMEKIPDYVY